jgi:hypothetical protein
LYKFGFNFKIFTMKLYPITTTRLQLLESGQFIIRLLTDFDNSGLVATTDAEFKIQLDELRAQSPIYNNALMQVKAKAESEELIGLDLLRDQKFSSLRRALSAYEFEDDAVEKMAYLALNVILRRYNDLEKANYEAQSLGIDKLVVEFRIAKDSAIDTLQLRRFVDHLAVANDAFKTMFNTRSSNTISTVTYDTKALRTAIFNTYKELAEYSLVIAKRKKNDPFYSTLMDVLNTGREYYADILARRKGINERDNPAA